MIEYLSNRACSSVVERISYKDEVLGSIPSTPTLRQAQCKQLKGLALSKRSESKGG